MSQEYKQSIQVTIRVRPPGEKEIHDDPRLCIKIDQQSHSVILLNNNQSKTFVFDSIFDLDHTQQDLFNHVGKNSTNRCLEGYNCSVFAYGQTGAGKTFTMMGVGYQDSSSYQKRGLIPRTLQYMFELIQQDKLLSGAEYLIKCTFLEIYNEQIIDLLNKSSLNLQIREDLKKGVYVESIQEEIISKSTEAMDLLKRGSKGRHVGSTHYNEASSRSHSVFSISLESKSSKNGITNVKSRKFHFIDLAGSERTKQSNGDRLKEGCSINKSLHVLGMVINSLVESTEGKARHINYRDSKLTFLLKDALGGNSKTHLIANISPIYVSYNETLSTLTFARRVKLIKLRNVSINEDASGNIESLKIEIRRLKQEMILLKSESSQQIQQMIENHEDTQQTKVEQILSKSEAKLKLERLLQEYVQESIDKETKFEIELLRKQERLIQLEQGLEHFNKNQIHLRMIIKLYEEKFKRGNLGVQLQSNSVIENIKKENQILRKQNSQLILQLTPLLKSLFSRKGEEEELTAQIENSLQMLHHIREKVCGRIEEREELNRLMENYIINEEQHMSPKKRMILEKEFQSKENEFNDRLESCMLEIAYIKGQLEEKELIIQEFIEKDITVTALLDDQNASIMNLKNQIQQLEADQQQTNRVLQNANQQQVQLKSLITQLEKELRAQVLIENNLQMELQEYRTKIYQLENQKTRYKEQIQRESTSWQQAIDLERSKCGRLEEQVRSKNREIQEKADQSRNLISTIEVITKQKQQSDGLKYQLELQSQQLRKKLDSNEQVIIGLNNEILEKTEWILRCQRLIADKTRQCELKQAQIQSLSNQIQHASSRYETHLQNLQIELLHRKQEWQKELNSSIIIRQQSSIKIDALNLQITRLEDQISRLDDVETINKQLLNCNMQLKAELVDLNALLQNQRDQFNAKINKLQQDIATAQIFNRQILNQVKNYKTKQISVQQKLSILTDNYRHLEEQHRANLQEMILQKNRLTYELHQEKEKNVKTQQAMNNNVVEMNKLEQAKQQNQNKQRILLTQNDRLRQQQLILNKQIEKSTKLINVLHSRIQEEVHTRKVQQISISDLRNQIIRLQLQMDQLRQDTIPRTEIVRIMSIDNEKSIIEEIQMKVKDRQLHLSTLEAIRNQNCIQIQALRQQNQSCRQTISYNQAQKISLQQQNIAKTDLLQEVRNTVRQIQSSNSKLVEERQMADRQIEQLNDKLRLVKIQLLRSQEEQKIATYNQTITMERIMKQKQLLQQEGQQLKKCLQKQIENQMVLKQQMQCMLNTLQQSKKAEVCDSNLISRQKEFNQMLADRDQRIHQLMTRLQQLKTQGDANINLREKLRIKLKDMQQAELQFNQTRFSSLDKLKDSFVEQTTNLKTIIADQQSQIRSMSQQLTKYQQYQNNLKSQDNLRQYQQRMRNAQAKYKEVFEQLNIALIAHEELEEQLLNENQKVDQLKALLRNSDDHRKHLEAELNTEYRKNTELMVKLKAQQHKKIYRLQSERRQTKANLNRPQQKQSEKTKIQVQLMEKIKNLEKQSKAKDQFHISQTENLKRDFMKLEQNYELIKTQFQQGQRQKEESLVIVAEYEKLIVRQQQNIEAKDLEILELKKQIQSKYKNNNSIQLIDISEKQLQYINRLKEQNSALKKEKYVLTDKLQTSQKNVIEQKSIPKDLNKAEWFHKQEIERLTSQLKIFQQICSQIMSLLGYKSKEVTKKMIIQAVQEMVKELQDQRYRLKDKEQQLIKRRLQLQILGKEHQRLKDKINQVRSIQQMNRDIDPIKTQDSFSKRIRLEPKLTESIREDPENIIRPKDRSLRNRYG